MLATVMYRTIWTSPSKSLTYLEVVSDGLGSVRRN